MKTNLEKLLFNSDNMSIKQIQDLLKGIRVQKQRWLGTHHPDSNVRREAFRASGVKIGKDVFISIGMVVLDDYRHNVKIGDRVAFGNYVSLISASAPNKSLLRNISYVKEKLIKYAPITIKNDVWVGSGAIILPGVTIGEKSLIGANSLVIKDIRPYSMVVGSPAKLIKTMENEKR